MHDLPLTDPSRLVWESLFNEAHRRRRAARSRRLRGESMADVRRNLRTQADALDAMRARLENCRQSA